MPYPSSDMVRITCERCGFDGHYLREMGHQCRVFVSLDEYERNKQDAARYRFLQRTTCGNTAGGKGSDEECYLSLNPRDMDAAIDQAIADTPAATERRL